MRRQKRSMQPQAEGLEDRQLLAKYFLPNGSPINLQDLNRLILQRKNGVPLPDRLLHYSTPDGANVTLKLFGAGSLQGTTVRPDGTLDLVYNGTNVNSVITSFVQGGSTAPKLGTIRDANVTNINNLTGVGANIVKTVNLPKFDLIEGGKVNLMGGVGIFNLDAAANNSQINLRSIPNFNARPTVSTSSGSIVTTTTSGVQLIASTNSTTTSSTTAPTTVTLNGLTYNYVDETNGGRSLVSVTGTFTPGPNLLGTRAPNAAGPTPAPAGMKVTINHVNGAPRSGPTLGDSQVFAYDATANKLIRFNTVTGAQTLVVNLPGTANASTGLGLAHNGNKLVALVTQGTTVTAYDAISGAGVGQFSAANLPAGFHQINGVGSSEATTILTDSSINTAEPIDVTASLASGQAVAAGNPFIPNRELLLSGGVTGVAGSNTLYSVSGAQFDGFQPGVNLLGVLALSNSPSTGLREVSRTAVTALGQFIPNTNPGSKNIPLGSVDASLALGGLVANGVNIVTLYSPTGLATQGVITLKDANKLTAISSSFHPELVDTALVDIEGNTQSFVAQDVTGLALNGNGNFNLIQITNATDSSIIGLPIGHVNITHRNNVTITSSARTFIYQGGVANVPNFVRGGVTINKNIRPIGPLSLPT